jgi:(4S)-4-hydroxy-5-phosphonooxypentane-2,3-dione isomerase
MDQSGTKKRVVAIRFIKVDSENEIGHSFRDNIQRRHALQIVTDTLFDAFVSERHGLMQMTKQAVIVKYRVRPSRMNEFLSLLRAHIGRTKATEPGCVQFDLLMPHRQVDTVHLYEVYADEAAFNFHNSSQTLADYKAKSEPLLLERSVEWCTVSE